MRSLRTSIERIARFLEPKSHVVGLGRWKSSYPEEKKNSQWFHDMCSQDNCFTNATFLKRTYISAPPPSPPSPPPPQPPLMPAIFEEKSEKLSLNLDFNDYDEYIFILMQEPKIKISVESN